MRALLDTHAFLWFITDNPQLSSTALGFIEDLDNEIYVSTACLWEVAIKSSIGKLNLSRPFGELIPVQLRQNQFLVLNIKADHLARLIELPFHHRDPFDRLLIAQSMVEDLPIVSRDGAFPEYSVDCIW